MKVPIAVLDIRVSISDNELVINCIPHPLTRKAPKAFVFDCDPLPLDVKAWLNLLEKKKL